MTMIRFSFLCFCFFSIAAFAQTKQRLCEEPRIIFFSEFLTEEECDQIMADAEPRLIRSRVVGSAGDQLDSRRTSYGMFFPQIPTQPHLQNLQKRISDITGLPVENGEGFHVLRYGLGAEYQPHFD